MSFLRPLTRSARDGVGQPVLRKDDARLLVGAGRYSDDVNLPGQAYACFVRSPHAHAWVGRIETAGAHATPGVIAALTGADAAADGLKPLTHSPMPANPHEEIVRRQHVAFLAPHPPIPSDRVRFVGEVVVMVIAETPAAARDGAERVVVQWTPLPPATGSLAAADPGAPILYDGTTSNVCVDVPVGDTVGVGEAFARVFATFPDARFGNARHVVAGERGVSEWVFTGNAADGRKVEVNGCDLFTFRDGKIAIKSSYFKNRTA